MNERPTSRDDRISELKTLPGRDKANFIPPVGTRFSFGGIFEFRVTMHNVGQMRFTAELYDIHEPEKEIITLPSSTEAK